MSGLTLISTTERFRLAEVFTISRGSRTEAQVLTAHVSTGAHTGWGECVPYARYGETMDSVAAALVAVAPALADADPDTVDARDHLPPGAARNALDCALWDLRAKRSDQRVWQLVSRPAPVPVQTAFTLSLDTPEAMEKAARKHAARPLLKLKLGGQGDLARLEAVRAGAPGTRIIVDANEGWDVETYRSLAPVLLRLGVEMVEQPLPAGDDDALLGLERPLPVCADESCHDRASLAGLAGKYDMVNVKLDKAGGLTEALALCDAAQAAGFDIMVGCMVGTSLAMAPATLLAQMARIVDLDGPLLLAEDRADPLVYDADGVHPPASALWG